MEDQRAVRRAGRSLVRMHFLILLAAASAQPPRPAAITRQPKASVRILRAEPASREWNRKSGAHKREMLVREADGTMTRLRLVEYE